MAYKLIETESRRVHNEGEPTGFGLYLSTTKGKRRKYVADYSTIQDLVKTLTNEGMVLIVDIKRKRKFPLLHFIGRIKG